MANTFLDHVYKIDTVFTTASPGSDKSGETIPALAFDSGSYSFDVVRWVAPVGTAVITDPAGNTIWEATAQGATIDIESRAPMRAPGFRVPTLGGGRLYLYHSVALDGR
jgi:hypothetical protein